MPTSPVTSEAWHSLSTTGRLCVAALCCCLALPAVTAARDDEEKSEPPPAEKRLKQTEEGLLRNIWWNQDEVVRKLGLGENQRSEMDAVFQDFRRQRLEKQAVDPALREGFVDALRQGQWEKARRVKEQMADLAAERVAAQPGMKIAVLSLLTVEQLKTLGAEYDHLFQRPWLRRMSMGSGGRGAPRERRGVEGDRESSAFQRKPKGG